MSDLLPHNATAEERAISESLARIGNVPVPFRDDWNPDTCAAGRLPWLAWAFSVDEWDTNWSEAQQRAAVKASFAIHRRKGTRAAVNLAMASLGLDIEITEWFQKEPPGDPYTFSASIVVEQEPIPSVAAYDQIIAVANSAKNLRSHMLGVDIKGISRGNEYVAAATYFGQIITISAEPAP